MESKEPYTIKPQPEPAKGREDIWPLVEKDMEGKVKAGKRKYGVVLQSHNGRDALLDAYDEAIDLVFYLRQAIAERDGIMGNITWEETD